MKLEHLENQFAAMGARLVPRLVPVNWRNSPDYAMDIQRDRRGQFFELRMPETMKDQLELCVLQAQPRERHLLLLVRRNESEPLHDRFLCGHDEREWFVAAVPGRVSSVADAMESLKPSEVRVAQAKAGLKARQRKARKNRAFRRQGEWLFVPAPYLNPVRKRVLRNEPIRRGAGKPHIVELLYREGGTQVYVCAQFPNGVTEREYRRLLGEDQSRSQWGWRRMQRDAAVYARGQVRHPDHHPITLREWHRVLMNTETQSRTMRRVAFLD
jgi:hypothetical protein